MSRSWARVCASSRVSTDMGPCCRWGGGGARGFRPVPPRAQRRVVVSSESRAAGLVSAASSAAGPRLHRELGRGSSGALSSGALSSGEARAGDVREGGGDAGAVVAAGALGAGGEEGVEEEPGLGRVERPCGDEAPVQEVVFGAGAPVGVGEGRAGAGAGGEDDGDPAGEPLQGVDEPGGTWPAPKAARTRPSWRSRCRRGVRPGRRRRG